MKRLLLILLACLPLLLSAQSVDYYLNLGNSAYDQCNYNDALYYYQRAGEIANTTKVRSKITLARNCQNLDQLARRAEQYGTEQEERKYLNELYKLHKSPLVKKRLDTIRQRRLQLQAEREAEERARQREEAERQQQAEENAWYWAADENTISSYTNFIDQYPTSSYVEEAQSRIASLREAQAWEDACRTNTVSAYQSYISGGGLRTDEAYRKIDECYWEQAMKANTIDAYREYINRSASPKNHLDEAARRVADIEDANNWDLACKTHTVDAYQDYIRNGGKRVEDAHKKIDDLYWMFAMRDNTIVAYQQYIDRVTDARKAHLDAAQNRVDVMTRQEELIATAERTKDPAVAYNLAREARSLGRLRSEDLQRVLEVEEPYMFAQAKNRKATLSQRKEYVKKYSSVAQYENLKKIEKKITRQERKQERERKAQARREERKARSLMASNPKVSDTPAGLPSETKMASGMTYTASAVYGTPVTQPTTVTYSVSDDISTHHLEGMFGVGINIKENSLDYLVGGQYSYLHRVGGFYINYLYDIDSGHSLFQAGPAFRLTQRDDAKVDVSLSFGPSFLTDFHSCYYGGNVGLRFAQHKDGFCWWGGQIGCSYLSNGQIIPSVSLSFGVTLCAGAVAGCVVGGVLGAAKK